MQGLPLNPKLSNFTISPDESKIALTNTTNEGVELWIADLKTLSAKRIYGSNINSTLGDPITWLKNNNELLIKRDTKFWNETWHKHYPMIIQFVRHLLIPNIQKSFVYVNRIFDMVKQSFGNL